MGKHSLDAGRQRFGAMAGNLPGRGGSHEEHRRLGEACALAVVQAAEVDSGWSRSSRHCARTRPDLANNNEYDVYVAENIRIEGGKITHYRVYWDVSPIIKAFRNI